MTTRNALPIFVPVMLLLVLAGVPAVDRYRSNAVGIRGELLDGSDQETPEYILEVSYEDGLEVRSLIHEGAEIERVELVRDGAGLTERKFADGQITDEIIRDREGRLLSETHYAGGEPVERADYEYEGSFLTIRTVTAPDGGVISRESYSYWRDGTVRVVVKEEGGDIRTEYRYRNGRLEEEWISRPGESERFEFDLAGRLVMREVFADGTLVEQEARLYWGQESGSLLRQVIVSAAEFVTTRTYDERGRLTGERVEEDSMIVRELERVFAENLLVAETERDSAGRRSWSYDYSADGERTAVTYREDGEIVEIEYLLAAEETGSADRIVELYNRGELVLRVYYEGRTRLREEVIRGGEIIRVRDFSRETPDEGAGDRSGLPLSTRGTAA